MAFSFKNITYPEQLVCPSCKESIKIDYSAPRTASSKDLVAMMIDIPQSTISARDARSRKQNVDYKPIKIIFCVKCNTILGTTA
ncbi:MAG: hypothetical protein ACXAEU_18245 [Candidatus Hodarchaeales archaeon]|jgi:hypothetical protein